MSRLIPLPLLVLLFATASFSGDAPIPSSGFREPILAAVNAEFLRVRPCGVASGPSSYLVDHLAVEGEWACIAGKALYQFPSSPFAVEFIALLKWNCGCWRVASISFDAAHVTRRKFLGMRQVPPAILPRWIRWSR